MTQQQGFSLIEVLASLLIVVIMAVGATGYQLFASQKTIESQYRTQAVWLANSVMGRLEINPNLAGQWQAPKDTLSGEDSCIDISNHVCTSSVGGCDAAALNTYDINDLTCVGENSLPGGKIYLSCGAIADDQRDCAVNVVWDLPERKINKQELNDRFGRVEVKRTIEL